MYIKLKQFEKDFYSFINLELKKMFNLDKYHQTNDNASILHSETIIMKNKYYENLKILFPPNVTVLDQNTSLDYLGKRYYDLLTRISNEEELKQSLNNLFSEWSKFCSDLMKLDLLNVKYPFYLKDKNAFDTNIFTFIKLQHERMSKSFTKHMPNFLVHPTKKI